MERFKRSGGRGARFFRGAAGGRSHRPFNRLEFPVSNFEFAR
jgi:hypothetical protein